MIKNTTVTLYQFDAYIKFPHFHVIFGLNLWPLLYGNVSVMRHKNKDLRTKRELIVLLSFTCNYVSLVMGNPAFCICENKDADQLRGNHEADQRLCFRYTDSTIPQLHKSVISSL